MELMLENGNGSSPDRHNSRNPSPRRQSYSPTHHNNSNPVPSGPTIEELLSVKYDTLNDAEQTDFATTIRNAILIPANLNVSDDCLRILCNRRAQEAENSLVLDTTAESPEKSYVAVNGGSQSSSSSSLGSEAISDQDLRCARELAELGIGDHPVERRVLRQVSPLPKGMVISGTPILNGDNSGNAVFNVDHGSANGHGHCPATGVAKSDQLTFNGRIPAAQEPRPDHVVIQIEPDTSLGRISVGGGVEEPVAANHDDKEECVEQADDLAGENKNHNKSKVAEESFEFTNERSPDLFADNDDEDEDYGHLESMENTVPDRLQLLANGVEEPKEATVTSAAERLMQRDNHLLKRLQTAFSGVLPPPSVTNVAISLDVIVSKYKEYNGQLPEPKQKLLPTMTTTTDTGRPTEDDPQELYLMKSVDSPTRAKTESWPELKNVICQDVYYNLSNAIEQYEYLTVKYRSRFAGSDTSSSFVLADLSSAKKRANRTKALNSNNSPGRRLSHLARRRAIFSCANLQGAKEAAAQAQQNAVDLSRVANRQILLPVRRRTVGRGTPGKKRKTPGSSAKKRALVANMTTSQQQRRELLTRETSKRALFQSPGTDQQQQQQQPVKPKVTPEVAIRVDKSKRALFSSPKFGRHPTFSGGTSGTMGPGASRMEMSKLRFNSMTSLTTTSVLRGSQESLMGKRKRDNDYSDDEDEENHGEQLKMLRTESPRRGSLGSADNAAGGSSGLHLSAGGKNFVRSQSFAVDQLGRQKSSLGLPRTSSEMHFTTGSRSQVLALNEGEKKKLLWVVSQTLLRNQVDGKNPKFKEYATVMAKVVKRIYLETVNRAVCSVSEQMSKLANNIAFQVMQNKNELEIYSAEKLRTQSMNRKKLTGYVNSLEYEQYKAAAVTTNNGSCRIRRMSSGVFSEASSVSLSQCSMVSAGGSGQVGGGGGHHTAAIDENFSQAATVLRENVDTEQRQQQQQQLRLSSQKNLSLVFSGKDQKNVSPYSGGEGAKRKLLVGGALVGGGSGSAPTLMQAKGLNVIKAKRQISFDA